MMSTFCVPAPAAVAPPLRLFRSGPKSAHGGNRHGFFVNGFPATLTVWKLEDGEDAPDDAIRFDSGVLATFRMDDDE